MKDIKIQWHPGFVAAVNLEFRENKHDLSFEKEHNLNTKPLVIDLLVIKKNKDAHIANEIGQIFRGHNIMEYKNPNDSLDIDVFHKSLAYACLYKSYGQTVDGIQADDVTFSLLREARPYGLFSSLKKYGYTLSEQYPGIYYVYGNIPFPAQIVVMRDISRDAHVWLSSLSSHLQIGDMKRLAVAAKSLVEKDDLEFADSVVTVSVKANKDIVLKMKGDDSMDSMFEMFCEIWQSKIDAMVKQEATDLAADIVAEKDKAIAERDSAIAEKDSAIAEKDSAIAMLTEQLKQLKQLSNA